MGDHRAVSYGLKLPARSLAALAGQENCRWAVGTTALREENEVHVLELDSRLASLRPVESYAHPDEIWAIVPHPSKHNQVATVANAGGRSRARIWNMEPAHNSLDLVGELETGAGLGSSGGGRFKALCWHPSSPEQLITVSESRLRRWTVRDASIDMVSDAGAGDLHQLWTAAWDPHDPSRLLTAGGCNIQVWDLRTMKKAGEIEAAHQMPVRDLDFSRQELHRCVSSGDDGRICFWDLRSTKPAQPLQAFQAHAHWVQSFEDHEDSIYAGAWNVSDPWTFAYLCYDGRVTVQTVPQQHRSKGS
ncbi:hypothetical protein WJX84_007366 [Apatococcus fuscideae]|uniref:EIPR1-like beta-propeller domain-containing protein n=1 Tax=Apatococcus fuscideae TaxID=2026836 RepID=A0AAW1TAC3_9CHLO